MTEEQKQAATERTWMMILTLLGFAGMIVWGIMKYGSAVMMWPSTHFWVTVVIGVWCALDILGFFIRRSKR